MKMKSFFTFALSILVFALTSSAQNPPSSWSQSVTDSSVAVGEEIEVVFRAIIPATYLVYSNDYDCPNGGPLPTVFNYVQTPDFELVGSPIPIGAEKVYDEIFECEISEFHKIAEFRQRIKILTENINISGVIEYQMCAASGLCVLHKYEYSIGNLTITPPN
jgi:hypothetical protein